MTVILQLLSHDSEHRVEFRILIVCCLLGDQLSTTLTLVVHTPIMRLVSNPTIHFLIVHLS